MSLLLRLSKNLYSVSSEIFEPVHSAVNTNYGSNCGITIGTGVLGRAAERVPFRKRRPNGFARRLGFLAQAPKIHAWNDAVFHPDLAVYDHGVDVIADTTLNDALYRVSNRSVPQRVAAREINNNDIGKSAGRQPAEVVAADRFGAA